MKNQTGIILAVAVFALLVGAGTVSAMGMFSGRGGAFGMFHGPQNATRPDMTAVNTAIANNDYTAWKSAMTDMFTAQLTQEHFNAIVTVQQDHKAVNDAITNDDYAAYQTAMASANAHQHTLTQTQFEQLVQDRKNPQNSTQTGMHPPFGHRGFGGGFGMGAPQGIPQN